VYIPARRVTTPHRCTQTGSGHAEDKVQSKGARAVIASDWEADAPLGLIDRAAYTRYLEDALAHLFDHFTLQLYPPGGLLVVDPGDSTMTSLNPVIKLSGVRISWLTHA
jgi:hypothetical protein